jgi:hypothetical protein
MHCKPPLEGRNSRTEKPSSRGARQCLPPKPPPISKQHKHKQLDINRSKFKQKAQTTYCRGSIAAALKPKHHPIPQYDASPLQNAYSFSPRVPASRRENKATSKHICYLGPLTSAPPFPSHSLPSPLSTPFKPPPHSAKHPQSLRGILPLMMMRDTCRLEIESAKCQVPSAKRLGQETNLAG